MQVLYFLQKSLFYVKKYGSQKGRGLWILIYILL